MATPMTASQFVNALRGEGVNVSEYRSWRTHNRNHKGRWGGMNGIVIHHTAGRNSLSLCYNGTSSLPGPLCHTHLSKSAKASMVGNGRANHAGSFPANAFNAMVNESSHHPRPSGAETIDANAHTYGLEIENLGNGDDFYPDEQYDAAVRWAAAICRFHGWSADSVIGHKEGTRRKIDPKGPVGSEDGADFSMDRFRADVAKRLSGKASDGKAPAPSPAPSKPAEKPSPKPAGVARYKVTIDGKQYGYGAYGAHVTAVGKALVSKGFDKHYKEGPGPRWSDADTKNYQLFQRSLGYSGSDADGVPGKSSLGKLMASRPKPKPTVDLSNVIAAAKADPSARQGSAKHRADSLVVEKALVAEGLLAAKWADGSFGSKTIEGYAAWQRRCGYSGRAADGIPGHESLARLGDRRKFAVRA